MSATETTPKTAPARLLPKHYTTILSPVISEKTSLISGFRQFVFRVAPDSTKPQIREAVEQLFKVNVTAVNTHNRKGKATRFKGRKGRRSDVKFAIVTLAEGQSIDVQTGL